MITRKVDSNDMAFRAELVAKAKVPLKKRFNILANNFREQTKNFPDRKFIISQVSKDVVALQLDSKNKYSLIEGIYTDSLDKKFKQMADNDMNKFFYSAFKLLVLAEKYHELFYAITETSAKHQHNLDLLAIFRKKQNPDFIKRYETFSQFSAKKIKILTQELNNVKNSFNNLSERASKLYPELRDISL